MLRGDAGYLLNNMIAKYSLAADTYVLSLGSLSRMRSLSVNLDETHTRRKFYGRDKPFIYEHPVPAAVVREALLQTDGLEDAIRSLLVAMGPATVLLRTEEAKLQEAGLSSKMPDGWHIGDDPFARYEAASIPVSTETVRVCGAICR